MDALFGEPSNRENEAGMRHYLITFSTHISSRCWAEVWSKVTVNPLLAVSVVTDLVLVDNAVILGESQEILVMAF